MPQAAPRSVKFAPRPKPRSGDESDNFRLSNQRRTVDQGARLLHDDDGAISSPIH
jgi:hypothetical protein